MLVIVATFLYGYEGKPSTNPSRAWGGNQRTRSRGADLKECERKKKVFFGGRTISKEAYLQHITTHKSIPWPCVETVNHTNSPLKKSKLQKLVSNTNQRTLKMVSLALSSFKSCSQPAQHVPGKPRPNDVSLRDSPDLLRTTSHTYLNCTGRKRHDQMPNLMCSQLFVCLFFLGLGGIQCFNEKCNWS